MNVSEPVVDVSRLEKRLRGLGDVRRRQSGASRLTEMYFERDRTDAPLLIVHHIRKTAGTSLREVMKANYGQADRVLVPGVGYKKGVEVSRARMLDSHARLWQGLSPDERAALRCVASHEANFLKPFVDRPCLVATLVRQPVDRVLSRYYFANRPTSGQTTKKTRGWRNRGVRAGVSRVLRQIPLEQVYSAEGAGSADIPKNESALGWLSLFNGQARSILEPFYDTSTLRPTEGPSEDADIWRGRLKDVVAEHYMLGVSELFEGFVEVVSQRFGWTERFSPRAKVNTGRPTADTLDEELLASIARYNWLDVEIYEQQVQTWSAHRGEAERRS